MDPETTVNTGTQNYAARVRMLSRPGEPLFLCEWDRALVVHYEIDPAILQPLVPFPLDLRGGFPACV